MSGVQVGVAEFTPNSFRGGNALAPNRIRGELPKLASKRIRGKPRAFSRTASTIIMVTVYVLRSQSSAQHYVGITKDLRRRLEEHDQGRSRATRNRGPWNLLYTEECPDYSFARKRERFFKSGPGHAFLKKRVQ